MNGLPRMICPRSEAHHEPMRLKSLGITALPEVPMEDTNTEHFVWRHHWVGCCPICHTHVEVIWDAIES